MSKEKEKEREGENMSCCVTMLCGVVDNSGDGAHNMYIAWSKVWA